MAASKKEIDLIVEELVSLDRKKQFMDEWKSMCRQTLNEHNMEFSEETLEIHPEEWEDVQPQHEEPVFAGKIIGMIVASAFAILATLCLAFAL